MFFTAENILLIGSILLFVSVLVSKASNKFGIPTLLLFLFVGMFFGVDGVGFEFSNIHLTQFIGMVALCVILYTGGMGTKLTDIKPIWKQGLVLSTVGVFLTAFVTGVFIWYLSGLSWTAIFFPFSISLLLASTMASTDSASVFAILSSQKMNLKNNLRPMLELESGSNDPMAYLMTIVLIQVAASSGFNAADIALEFVIQFVVGALFGYALGKATVWVLNKIKIDLKSLYPIFLLTSAFFTFSFTDLLNGNGYLAVYIAGVIVGNSKIINRKDVNIFLDGLTWLFQMIMFLCLGLLVNPREMLHIAPLATLIGLFMIFIARPLSVFVSLIPFGKKISAKSKLFISWVGLRGAVPIIFATYPAAEEIDGAEQIFNIVFFITILSLIIQGSTISWMAKKLKLDAPADENDSALEMEFSDGINLATQELLITAEHLENGCTLKEMNLPKGALVVVIKRGANHLVPNGTLEIKEGDRFLMVYGD
ncbi:MAG: potassium/proton antiporter [Bacteroidia bacterium]|nr:potassium/proton antiporter [Bacteroidia bacterium]